MAASTFDTALALVLELEGGFVNDPRDPGGATKFGITRATLSAARGRPVTVDDVKALTRAEAGAIYRRSYWDATEADRLPPGLDLAAFDLAVNSGVGRSARLLQQVLKVRVDGLIGPDTLAAAAAADPRQAVSDLTRERLAFLRGLPTWPVYGRGWTNRVNRVASASLAAILAGSPPGKRTTSAEVQTGTEQQKERDMDMSKTILASRTVWANLIGFASLGLGMVGVKTGSIDVNGLADAASQVVAGASFIASTFFRVSATKQIASGAS